MASYKDYKVTISELPDVIVDKLAGVYSVEVVRVGHGAKLRMWVDQHCELSEHDKVDDDE